MARTDESRTDESRTGESKTDESRTDEYRDQAAECLDSARSVADAKAKLELLAMAKGYLDLADLVESSANDRDDR